MMSASHQALQKTLKQSVYCEGVGVHSGKKASLTFHAAPAHTGIVFVRGDLTTKEDDFIFSHVHSVVDTAFCTTLSNAKGHKARTVEHVLAAFKGCGIDNAIIELHGEELPIMDGSSAPFVEMIERSGIRNLEEAASFLRIL
ncbi:MAG: UDP-3-O-acyl-N-acetylglucosamine deacetylase, partial [Alphaproteobacteria bacterium]|nr:UDP-3-O-acyl-N-acetylglucosamine deacetylase [Alphaproteobacteria bacterium]